MKYTLTLLVSVIIMHNIYCVEVIENDANVPIYKIEATKDFGRSELSGFFTVRLPVEAGKVYDGYVTKNKGYEIHNIRCSLIARVIQMETVTMLILRDGNNVAKIYIPKDWYSFSEIAAILNSK